MDEDISERINQLRDVKARAFKGGCDEKIALQHALEVQANSSRKNRASSGQRQFKEKYSNPIREASANWGIVDMIEAEETRRALIRRLKLLCRKRRKVTAWKRHGNMPM